MTITLDRFANGDTDYIGKHNGNADVIEGAVNTLQTQVGTLVTGTSRFTSLIDTPNTYTGSAGKVVIVNGSANGLTFADASAPSAFTGLSDVPAAYTDAADQKVRVNGTEDGLEFVPDAFVSLIDAPSDYTDQGGKLIAVKLDESGVEFVDAISPESLLGLSDTPGAYTDAAGYLLAVNGTEDAVEFIDPTTVGVTEFTALSDAPSDYDGHAGKAVIVNSGETGLEFSTFDASAFTGLSDTFSDYTGLAYRVLMVNGTEDGISVTDMATPTAFIGLTDAPESYSGESGKVVAVKGDESGLEFVDGATQAELDVVGAIATAAASAASDAQDDIDAITVVGQNANIVYAGPASGSAAAPTFRALVASDMPSAAKIATPAFATTLTLDLSTIKDGGIFRVTLTDNCTVELSNGTDGQKFIMELLQDGGGGNTVTLSTSYFRFGTDITDFTATVTGDKMDRIGCIYRSANSKADVVAVSQGF